jgi:hypothetical protein
MRCVCKDVKLTIFIHLVPKLRMVELFLYSQDLLLAWGNVIKRRTLSYFLPFKVKNYKHGDEA